MAHQRKVFSIARTAQPSLRRRLQRLRTLALDTRALHDSRDLRRLVGAQAISVLGSQLTAVALPYQVYRLTGSSLQVGLAALATVPLMALASLVGGALVDRTDRRRLLVLLSVVLALLSGGLAVNASASPALWPLFVLPALAAGLATVEDSAINAVLPGLVPSGELPAVNAMFQAVFQLGLVVGPTLARLILAGSGARCLYAIDAVSFAVTAGLCFGLQPYRAERERQGSGWRTLTAGVAYVSRRPLIASAMLIDLNATVLGMPRALFPALAVTTFAAGPAALGLLYAAPGVGALVGALTSGWISRVERQGRAVILAVIVWGLAIAAFGVVPWLALALCLLAIAGWADVISAIFRSSIIQLSVPDRLRGRLIGLQSLAVTGGPRLGDLEAGAAASAVGTVPAIVTGGLGCVAGALAIARLIPQLRDQRADRSAPFAAALGQREHEGVR
jgi:MFS family permease